MYNSCHVILLIGLFTVIPAGLYTLNIATFLSGSCFYVKKRPQSNITTLCCCRKVAKETGLNLSLHLSQSLSIIAPYSILELLCIILSIVTFFCFLPFLPSFILNLFSSLSSFFLLSCPASKNHCLFPRRRRTS